MNWTEVIKQIFELLLYPLITIGGAYLVYLASAKIKELQERTNNDVAKKYLSMLDDTITNAVLATTQTYVEALKKEGKFDLEAQQAAFNMTYDAVKAVLTDEALKYINAVVGDVDTYVTTKIEATVKMSK